MPGIQIASLTIIVELAMMEVLIQRASTLLRMRLDQNSILRKARMTRGNQQHQCLVAIWIVLDLIELRMRRRDNLIVLEMMMNDSFPAWYLTMTEFWDPSCRSVSAFDHRERFLRSKFSVGQKIDTVVMRNSTEVNVEVPNCRGIQPFE
mgnify:CR=1 FL=1